MSVWRKRRPKRRRRFSLTRQGKGYVFVTFGVGVAAINTGNNLLYLILGLLLSLLLVSGTLSDLALFQLRAKRRLPARLYVGRAHDVEVTLENAKRVLPSFSLEVREEVAAVNVGGHPPEGGALGGGLRGGGLGGHPPEGGGSGGPGGHPPDANRLGGHPPRLEAPALEGHPLGAGRPPAFTARGR